MHLVESQFSGPSLPAWNQSVARHRWFGKLERTSSLPEYRGTALVWVSEVSPLEAKPGI